MNGDIVKKEVKERKEEEPNVTVSVSSGSFPLELFKEWDKDCKEFFGDVRWLKMWHDHTFTQEFKKVLGVFDEIQAVHDRVDRLEESLLKKETKNKEEKEKKAPLTFGDTKEE